MTLGVTRGTLIGVQRGKLRNKTISKLFCAVVIFFWFLTPDMHAQSQHVDQSPGSQVDLLIAHSTIIDGSGAEPHVTDLGIRGDRIAFVGDAKKA